MRSDRFESISIDRRSSVSYDDQIKESIKALILDQTFYYQALLPTPQQLAKLLHVETELTEKAYKKLVKENYIKYIDPKGYVVAYFELTNYFFYRNIAIYDAISALGLSPSIECIEKKVVQLTDAELQSMGFSTGEKLFYINRIYKGNDKPIIILENYIPLSIFKDMDKKFTGNEPLNAYMDKEYNLKAKLSFRVKKQSIYHLNLHQYLEKEKMLLALNPRTKSMINLIDLSIMDKATQHQVTTSKRL